ncbi:unnamed protein product [Parnassius mnemosyne]|uniref:Uncharacterized protein n=1 Tax=Parnassius mnemosyne TaxID=213953 RepID=A0AAV1KUN7_9NEOP
MMNDRGIDVLCVNETKRKGRDVTAHGMYTAYWSGVDETERACQGVGVILSERMGQCVKEYECVSPRLLWIRMKVGLKKLFVIQVYAPTSTHNNEEVEKMHEDISGVIHSSKTHYTA